MFDIIDPYVPVSWCLEFNNGDRWFDSNIYERAWIIAKDKIEKEKLTLRRMYLFAKENITGPTTFNGVLTPEYCLGYFFSKKVIANFATGSSNHLYAIGHFDQDTNELDIRWYNAHMSLIEREKRPVEKAKVGYIPNYIDDEK